MSDSTNLSLWLNLQQLLADYRQRIHRVSPDYYSEVDGWFRVGSRSGKCLLYKDWQTFRTLQQMGCKLFRECETVQSVISKMISYVVSSGHSYGVSVRDVPGTISRVKVSDRLLDEVEAIVEITMDTAFPGGWQAMQEESVLRLFREGEFFRRLFLDSDGIAVRFIEPDRIRPPRMDDEGNRNLGTIPAEGDVVNVEGYWYWNPPPGANDPYNLAYFEQLPATEVQHAKQGVDANDPRGIPILWQTYCHSQRIREVDVAMCELAITQASYAVIRQYDNTISIDDMRRIARGFAEEKEDNEGRPIPGTEVDAKGFKFEFPSMDVRASEFVEIIAQQLRFIGGLMDMPEFLVSSDARTGNRSSLVTAEGPFDRRVQREQKKLANHDIELLWRAIQAQKNWTDSRLREYRKVIKLEPRFPVAASRDFNKWVESQISLVDKGLRSPQQACSQIGGDYDITQAQIDRHNKEYPDRKVAETPPDPVGPAAIAGKSPAKPKPKSTD